MHYTYAVFVGSNEKFKRLKSIERQLIKKRWQSDYQTNSKTLTYTTILINNLNGKKYSFENNKKKLKKTFLPVRSYKFTRLLQYNNRCLQKSDFLICFKWSLIAKILVYSITKSTIKVFRSLFLDVICYWNFNCCDRRNEKYSYECTRIMIISRLVILGYTIVTNIILNNYT